MENVIDLFISSTLINSELFYFILFRNQFNDWHSNSYHAFGTLKTVSLESFYFEWITVKQCEVLLQR